MALLEILSYPNPVLRRETMPVEKFDDSLKRLFADMRETMYASNGVGLAAPQVGVSLRAVVIEWEDIRYSIANPEIIEQSGEEKASEGCLSFPGIHEEIKRPTMVRVRYQTEDGEHREEVIEGFPARIFAHEIDHLNGVLMLDHLSPLKRGFLKKKLERKAKQDV